jgi:uncharacterized protein YacL
MMKVKIDKKTEKKEKDREKEVSANKTKRKTTRSGLKQIEALTKPTTEFTQALAREIVKNLTTFGQVTTQRFRKTAPEEEQASESALVEGPILVDSSVLIDGRIVPIVNSGFIAGTLLVPEFVLAEVQHVADSSESIRRAKGRRGLDVVSKLQSQKVNEQVKTKVISDDPVDVKEVDHKLVSLAKKWKTKANGKNVKLITVDFNLAQLARAQGVKILNINDLAQAIKVALLPGEEVAIRISHEGKEREQGVGYLDDGTMVVIDNTRDKVGQEVLAVITKVHHTPAGQLFFARPK